MHLFFFKQSNKLEKIPAGAFDNLRNLRELYLQNNNLNNEGIDNETFRWEWNQNPPGVQISHPLLPKQF